MWNMAYSAAALSGFVSPFTSDNSSLTWMVPVCAVSLVALVVLIIVGKKRK